MEKEKLDWPLLSIGKALQEYGEHPCITIDLRKYRFRSQRKVTISTLSGLLKMYIRKMTMALMEEL